MRPDYYVKPVATPRPRRTQAERLEQSGRRLLAAAAELIAEKGWEATTAAEIGRRAGYSRAMVHARYGSKDALLDTLFHNEYEERLNPSADEGADGLQRALAPFDRLGELYDDDPAFLSSMFVLSFEAVKRSSAVGARTTIWMEQIAGAVEQALLAGIDDGSVRDDVDVSAAVADIVASGVGLAFGWIVLPERFDLPAELERARVRFAAAYGSAARRPGARR